MVSNPIRTPGLNPSSSSRIFQLSTPPIAQSPRPQPTDNNKQPRSKQMASKPSTPRVTMTKHSHRMVHPSPTKMRRMARALQGIITYALQASSSMYRARCRRYSTCKPCKRMALNQTMSTWRGLSISRTSKTMYTSQR